MSALHRTNDATMDDIMASIRRIVSDEQPRRTAPPIGFNNEPISPANDFRTPLTPKAHVYDLTDQVQPVSVSDSTRALDPRNRVSDIEFSQKNQVQSFQQAVNPNEALLSNRTNAAVMASFEQLSQSFAQSTGLMNDMVREMLKPMLKQWLDDNLPPLVEKLIRAEIERVARGGK